jgi:hypothetical protein
MKTIDEARNFTAVAENKKWATDAGSRCGLTHKSALNDQEQ